MFLIREGLSMNELVCCFAWYSFNSILFNITLLQFNNFCQIILFSLMSNYFIVLMPQEISR